jgi:hypothetical protein
MEKQAVPSKSPLKTFCTTFVFVNPISFQESFAKNSTATRTTMPKTLCIKFSARIVSSVLIKKYSVILAILQTRKITIQLIIGFANIDFFIFITPVSLFAELIILQAN